MLAWLAEAIREDDTLLVEDDAGLLGPVPEWPYIDWARGWRRGVPPGGSDGAGGKVTTLVSPSSVATPALTGSFPPTFPFLLSLPAGRARCGRIEI